MKPFHNNFIMDTKHERADRLQSINSNAAKIAVRLALPADLATWIEICGEDFAAVRAKAEVNRNEKNIEKSSVSRFIKNLRSEYQKFKAIIRANFAEKPEVIEEFGMHLPTPADNAGMMDYAAQAIATYDRLAAENTPDLPEEDDFAEIRTLFAGAQTQAAGIESKQSAAVRARADYKKIWERDTAMLRRLAAQWFAKYDPEEASPSAIGCVAPRPRRAGMPPPPENLRREGGFIAWEEAERATTYQAHYRALPPPEQPETLAKKKKKAKRRTRINWLRLYQGEETRCPAPPKPAPYGYEIRVRARNANGFGKWSEELTIR